VGNLLGELSFRTYDTDSNSKIDASAVEGLHDPVTVVGAPLSVAGQQLMFNFDENQFQLDGNNLQIKNSVLHPAVTIADTSSIDLSITGQQISGLVLPAGVDHNSLNNYDTNKHIDHTEVSITAGDGLSGGGDLSTTRTLTNTDKGTVAVSTHESVYDHASYDVAAGWGYHAFVPRGSLSVPDYTEATLTRDGAYHDLDLSAIVPTGAVAVLLEIKLRDNAISGYMYVRKNGLTGANDSITLTVQITNETTYYPAIIVACDPNRVIEYFVSSGLDSVKLTVRGWWI